MTENEKWTECELADHAIGILISHCSACIYTEKKKQAPNQEQIKKWRNEQTELMKLRRSLTIDDMATIDRVNKTYGPQAQAIMRKE